MKRLTLTYKGHEIVSSIFNFKAYRVMSAALGEGVSGESLDEAAMQGLTAMFDGTPITASALRGDWRSFEGGSLAKALDKALQWFGEVKPRSAQAMVGDAPADPILSLYRSLLMGHGILPGAVDEQDPQLLIDVLNAEESGAVSADEIPDEMRIYYGL